MLSVRNLCSGHRAGAVLQGIDLDIAAGEIVAVVGGNGAGKTALLMTICGHRRLRTGEIRLDGEDVAHLSASDLARRGLAIVPEGRGIFPRLSVRENLRMGAFLRPADFAASLGEVLAFYPSLSAKLGQEAETLSIHERQMLAVARALMGRPRLLLLDEPSLGLSSPMMREAFDTIARIRRERKIAILIADQNAFQALKHADRAVVMADGRIAHRGTGTEILADSRMQSVFFGGRAAVSVETSAS